MDIIDEIPAEETTGILKEQLNAELVVLKITYYLAGYQYDPSKEAYILKKGITPMLNSEGISKIGSILRARISNINAYSRLKSEQINTIRSSISLELWQLLTIKYNEYDLDIHLLYTVLDIVDDSILLFLSRTEQGGFLSFIKGIFKTNESYSETEAPTNENKNSSLGGLGNLFN